jgi:hypothetical protein
MRFRLRAFGLHLFGSACVLALVLGSFYFGWYRWPGWYLSGVLTVVLVMCAVDVALGPSLTFIVANPHKARGVLKRDIMVIIAAQAVALIYGTTALWAGRPLYYTYSYKSLDLVQASDLEADEIAQALKENPAFAPHWYSRLRWVWAPPPADPEATAHIAGGAAFGAKDVVDMPRYFKPWVEGLPQLRKALQPVGAISALYQSDKDSATKQMAALGIPTTEANAIVLWGEEGTRPMVAVFDPGSLKVRATLRIRPLRGR